MPRVSIRKLFIYFLAVASLLLLAINIQQRTIGLFGISGTIFTTGDEFIHFSSYKKDMVINQVNKFR